MLYRDHGNCSVYSESTRTGSPKKCKLHTLVFTSENTNIIPILRLYHKSTSKTVSYTVHYSLFKLNCYLHNRYCFKCHSLTHDAFCVPNGPVLHEMECAVCCVDILSLFVHLYFSQIIVHLLTC